MEKDPFKEFSFVMGGNPLPLGGGRSFVNRYLLSLTLNIFLYSC